MHISNNNSQSPSSGNQNNSNNPTLLKIIENSNSDHHHQSEPQTSLRIQDVAPIATTTLTRKTSIGLTGPVTDL